MRTPALVGTALLLVLAGCAAPIVADEPASATPGTDGGTPVATPTATPAPVATDAPPAPPTDRLGWEDGYWHNATLAVDNADGLDDAELSAVLARAKARVEYIRGLEFDGSVNVTVVTRENFSAEDLRSGEVSPALRRFDNAKFEALFLIGGDTDSIETQDRSRNASVGGFYSPDRNAMVIVSDAATPTLESERTLAHELVHALQDQHFALGEDEPAGSRDAHNGRNGLIEGDPTTVHHAYLERCGDAWTCIEAPANGSGGGGGTLHLGVYLLQFFPYSDGPSLVASLRSAGGWDRVNAAYEHPPGSATEVIYPERYRRFTPREITLTDDLRGGWERVRPPDRPAHARLGQSALAAMLGYTLYDDYNPRALLDSDALLNLGPGGLNATDPLNYDLAPIRGWTGDRLHVYRHGESLGYRWRLTWASPAAAQRFADTYRDLLGHWGGTAAGGGDWTLPADSPFTGAYHLEVSGDTVTVAKAPTHAALADVSPAAR